MVLDIHPITIARADRGISQAELATEVGMGVNSLSALESNSRTKVYVHELVRMAEAMGIEEWWTLASEDNKRARIFRRPMSPERLKVLAANRLKRLTEARARKRANRN